MKGLQAVFCRICGIHLNNRKVVVTENICQSPFCRRLDANNVAAAKAREHAKALDQRREDLAEIVRERSLSVQPERSQVHSLKIVVLPYLEHKLMAPSMERRRQVAENFLKLASSAFALNSESASQPESVSNSAESESEQANETASDARDKRFAKMSGTACSTCGGKCCNLGGDTAFLSTDKFREVLRNRPTSSPEEIVAEYVDHIPFETFQDSCIFHGPTGCGLNRELRSLTCNTYLCVSLNELREGIDENVSNFLLAATNFRDVNDPKLKVLRLTYTNDDAERILLTDRP